MKRLNAVKVVGIESIKNYVFVDVTELGTHNSTSAFV